MFRRHKYKFHNFSGKLFCSSKKEANANRSMEQRMDLEKNSNPFAENWIYTALTFMTEKVSIYTNAKEGKKRGILSGFLLYYFC